MVIADNREDGGLVNGGKTLRHSIAMIHFPTLQRAGGYMIQRARARWTRSGQAAGDARAAIFPLLTANWAPFKGKLTWRLPFLVSLLTVSSLSVAVPGEESTTSTTSTQGTEGDPRDSRKLVEDAIRHEHAEGVVRDYKKAFNLYCNAGKAGNPDALFGLGWMIANGRGIPKNDGLAGKLFALAAERGHIHAGEMLRRIPASGTAELPKCLLPDPSPTLQAGINGKNNFSEHERHIFDLVSKHATRSAIDPNLVMAIISVESDFNVRARSRKNAQGLMQLIPETARRFDVVNPFDPEENIKGGVAYLQWLLSTFNGNVALTVAAYNAGEKAVEKYQGVPPYPETRDYVKKITSRYKKTVHPYTPKVEDPP